MSMNVKKFKIDDVIYYKPFKDDESVKSEILKNISEKSVILEVYSAQKNKYEIYDYRICILETGKIKKVKEKFLTFEE
jgi:hypothetical protein